MGKKVVGPALAPIWTRFAALGIDCTVLFFIVLIPFLGALLFIPEADLSTQFLTSLFIAFMVFCYFVLLEKKNGATIGKMIMGIEVSPYPINTWTCIVRNGSIAFLAIAGLLLFIDIAAMFFTKQRQRLFELLAKSTTVQRTKKRDFAIGYVFFVLVFIFFNSFILSFVLDTSSDSVDFSSGNVAIIPVKGVITGDSVDDVFMEYASAQDIVELIDEAADTDSVKAIVLEINSPGGSPVASDEIAQALQDANKPTVAWIREVGASGGYWIAASSDHIIAHPMTVTGSIGVIGSYLDFSRFISRYNISYERMAAGKYKDIGSPYRELTDEERALYQSKIDKLHDYFIQHVAKNRGLTYEQTKELSTGIIYLGSEAHELGLVDELGGRNEVINHLESTLNITVDAVFYEPEVTLFELLSAQSAQHLGYGMASALMDRSTIESSFELTT